jgi:5-bromo-4-chloroindolyl phosphate hydrolysis protein
MTTMNDLRTAKIRSHRRNIQRYARLLATTLSDLEREYLHKQIAHAHTELERWEKYEPEPTGIVAPVPDHGTSPAPR